MNYRRALRASTDTGLAVFLIMIVGVVLWTTDEVLDWNILPDWIDKFAQVIVIVLGILAGFSVVISVMCSFAVIAESAAAHAGMGSPVSSRRVRGTIAFGIVLVFGAMFGLHKFDQYRAAQRKVAEEQRILAKYAEAENTLAASIRNIVPLFTPDIVRDVAAIGTEAGDEKLARLLKAIRTSTPFEPEVSVMVAAEAPYKYCIITATPEQRDNRQDQPPSTPLKRQFLTDFPAAWESQIVAGMFRGEQLIVPTAKQGVFIDSRKPLAWGAVSSEGKVVAIVLLRAGI